jgi:hypothetical protein
LLNLNRTIAAQGHKQALLPRRPLSRDLRKSYRRIWGEFKSGEVRPRKDHRGVDLISDALPFGQLWYGEPNAISHAIGYATHRSRSHHAVIRVYDAVGNVIETHGHRAISKRALNSIHPVRLRTNKRTQFLSVCSHPRE